MRTGRTAAKPATHARRSVEDGGAEFVVGPGPATEAVFYFPHAEAASVTAAHDPLSATRRMTIP
jgi:hypothetical protein